MIKPESVFTAPLSAAAFARNASEAFFSAAAEASFRALASSEILGPKTLRSTFVSLFITPSVRPAFTSSSSAGLRLKTERFLLMARPRAYPPRRGRRSGPADDTRARWRVLSRLGRHRLPAGSAVEGQRPIRLSFVQGQAGGSWSGLRRGGPGGRGGLSKGIRRGRARRSFQAGSKGAPFEILL